MALTNQQVAARIRKIRKELDALEIAHSEPGRENTYRNIRRAQSALADVNIDMGYRL